MREICDTIALYSSGYYEEKAIKDSDNKDLEIQPTLQIEENESSQIKVCLKYCLIKILDEL